MTLPILINPIPSDRQIMAVPIFRSFDPRFSANFAALCVCQAYYRQSPCQPMYNNNTVNFGLSRISGDLTNHFDLDEIRVTVLYTFVCLG